MNEAPQITTPGARRLEPLVRLRIVVSVLGEAAYASWWRTEFLTAAGLRFLERLYPRTSRAAALRATGTAARDVHDKSIGRGAVYHLFRLPESLERNYHELARDGHVGEFLREIESVLEDRNALLGQLELLSVELPEAAPGPQRLGTLRELRSGTSVGPWAGAYLQAFRDNYKVFPYVEAEN